MCVYVCCMLILTIVRYDRKYYQKVIVCGLVEACNQHRYRSSYICFWSWIIVMLGGMVWRKRRDVRMKSQQSNNMFTFLVASIRNYGRYRIRVEWMSNKKGKKPIDSETEHIRCFCWGYIQIDHNKCRHILSLSIICYIDFFT